MDHTNHQYFPHCGSAGSSVLSDYYEFSCAPNFDKLEEIEFAVVGHNVSTGDIWSTTVRVTILHQCSEGIVTSASINLWSLSVQKYRDIED